MINPGNFKPVLPDRNLRSHSPVISVSLKAINLNPPLVEQLLGEQGATDTTGKGNIRIFLDIEYSRMDKAFRIKRGTSKTGFLFLTNASRSRNKSRHNASRGMSRVLKNMGLTPGRYVPKFPDQPDVFILDVKVPKPSN